MRAGLIAEKLGMSCIFNEAGQRIPVTLLKVEDCQVVGHKTLEKDGYNSLIIGAKNAKLSRVTKPMKQVFANAAVSPKAKLKEFRIDAESFINIGTDLNVDHFSLGQLVDVTGITIGKGFAGGMKRHNFRGLEASHGVSVSHRSHGSTGGRQDPGKVFKNKKMAGHMGCTQVTVQNLKVVAMDSEQNVIMIRGAIPGFKGSHLLIRDAVKQISSIA
jgi:large subunit ribosomal protein L3